MQATAVIQPYHVIIRTARLLILFLLPALGGFGQTYFLRGHVKDTIANKDCAGSIVALLRNDSTTVRSTRTDGEGRFQLRTSASSGIYLLLVVDSAYKPLYRSIRIGPNAPSDLGELVLNPRSDSLQAVIVLPRVLPPRMKGDTLEYNTENIRLKPNAAVEELLGRLPGLQIDANGNITFNGEKIQRLLVDGEDLFGSDPSIVTKNLNADMIAKVQVLDKKSDQAEFTGIDDGVRNKTLNLKLKESAKKGGYFGKLEAGGNTQGYYNANGLLGSFRDREQFTALGLASNTGSLGFNSGPGNSPAALSVLTGTGDALGASAGPGIPQVAATAVHYTNTWDGKVDHIVGNYQFGHLFTRPVTSSRNEQILPDSIYVQTQNSNSTNIQDQHRLNAQYDFVPDSLSALRLTFNGLTIRGHNQLGSVGSSTFNDTLVNSSLRTIRSDVNNQNFNGILSWRTRARKKPGRSLSLIANLAQGNNNTDGYLYARNLFYHSGGNLLRSDTTDQRKQIVSDNFILNSNLGYTEPLGKRTIIALGYGLLLNNSHSSQGTFDKAGGKYNEYIDSLSNNYQSRTLTQFGMLNLQGKGAHFTYTIGSNITWYSYRQQDLLLDSTLYYRYVNWAPHIFFTYTPGLYTNLTFGYSANTQQPSISQLQPVHNNYDPLHIVLGNPDLHPSLSQSFNLGFRRLKPFVLNLGLGFGFTSNSISTRTYTDSLGRQISQSVNTGGAQNASLNGGINKRLVSIGIDAGFHVNLSYTRSVNYINTTLSRNDNYNGGGGFTLAKYVPDKYTIQLNSNFSYFYARSSVNTAALTHYWTQAHTGTLSVFPFRGLEINTNALYTWQQKTSVFAANTSVLLWNAFVSQNFFENQMTLRVQLNNILDNNAGISRSSSGNSNSETRANILGRYWMVSAIWHFKARRGADRVVASTGK